MNKRLFSVFCLVLALSFVLVSISYAAESQTTGQKAKNFWQKLFKYPARVTEESSNVVADTGKKGTKVITTEVKRVGEVTSGELAKTKELVTEPITGTAEMAVKAVEGTVKVPVEAAKEEPAPVENK